MKTKRINPWPPPLPFLLLSLAIITLYVACGSSPPSDNDNNKNKILAGSDICNDQEGIQLSFRQVPPWGRLGYEHMMYENGSQYFLIDGTCKFWLFPGGLLGQNGIWNSVYTGQLTTELADEMAANLRLGRLESLAGFYAEGGNFDMPFRELRFQDLPLICEGPCGENERDQIFASMSQWITDLVEIANPVDTNMRGMFVLVGINYPPKDEFTLPDSLRNMANDPHMFLGAPPCPGTKTFLIDDKEALSAIRSYRKDLRAGLTLHPVNYPAIYVRNDDDTLLMFFVRDSIPLEDDRGFIDFNLTPGPNSAPNTGEPCR